MPHISRRSTAVSPTPALRPRSSRVIVIVYTRESVGWWPSSRSGSAPDLPLLLGAGKGFERGQLHPRAVPLYNLVHRFWGPLVLGALALAASLPAAWLVGALGLGDPHRRRPRCRLRPSYPRWLPALLAPTRAREIVAAARALLDEEGADALTMRRVAERLGIRAPSLYKHLSGKEALEAAVISGGFVELAADLRGRGRGRRRPARCARGRLSPRSRWSGRISTG